MGTFGELFETFKGDVEGVWVTEFGGVVLDGDVEDLDVRDRDIDSTFTMLMAEEVYWNTQVGKLDDCWFKKVEDSEARNEDGWYQGWWALMLAKEANNQVTKHALEP
jgi:hypothetical protein